jgi:PPOX class probable F420-dependent enzyme
VTSGRLAHFVTLNPDGSPQVSIVWVGLDGDEIVSGHLGARQKMKNVQRDGRVVLSVESDGVEPSGLPQYLVVQGAARVTSGGAPELLQQLARVYLGSGVKFPPMESPPPGYIVHVAPERIGGVGPWNPRVRPSTRSPSRIPIAPNLMKEITTLRSESARREVS